MIRIAVVLAIFNILGCQSDQIKVKAKTSNYDLENVNTGEVRIMQMIMLNALLRNSGKGIYCSFPQGTYR